MRRRVSVLDAEVGASDAVYLSPLTEAAFVANLHQRYKRDHIYTNVGTAVVSVNPYRQLALYSAPIMEAYRTARSTCDLPPHVFAVAEEALSSMRDRNLDQCVLLSGESGAGKTEASKHILQYLTYVSFDCPSLEVLKNHLLHFNPLLEAFGHAKTPCNDNSSRFGKYLHLEFNYQGEPVGGSLRHYLLEKVRVVTQEKGERNFHVFYQLLSTPDIHLLKYLKLQRNAAEYAVLGRGQPTAEDRTGFTATQRALDVLGVSSTEVLSIVAAVMRLGNLRFVPQPSLDGSEACGLANEYELHDACELLMGDPGVLLSVLTQRTLESHGSLIVAELNAAEANYARDALCKSLYSRLFTWLVSKINDTLKVKKVGKWKSIGILDIYGFEVFQKNGFEQFIINYCNEKLHQIFVELTLKEEQDEYIREGIEWEPIEYFNNSAICELIERNNHGILAVLDEECLRAGPVSDDTFLHKVARACQDSPYFEYPGASRKFLPDSPPLPNHCFRLRHFAGPVTYSVHGFLEKNNDLLYKEVTRAIYSSCDHPLLKVLFPEGNPCRTTVKRPATTATQFKTSISALMKNIHNRHPNYVRCIKPNELKQPMIFETALVLHQVRYSGLLEHVQICRAGFVHREVYDAFLRRYKLVSPSTWPSWPGLPEEGVARLFNDLSLHPSEFAFGRSKIFVRSPSTMAALEELRRERLEEIALLVQKVWRGWTQRNHFQAMRQAQRVIGITYRCWKRRKYLLWLSRHLPSESPLCTDWPRSPRCLRETNRLLRKLYHKWRCHKYRLRFDHAERNMMREKLIASGLFKDKKASYPKSVSHPFRGDYVRLRHNTKWKRMSAETGDQIVVFADIINKVTRSSGKCIQTLLVISSSAMLVVDQRTLDVRYRVPAADIYRISLSPYLDDVAVFHVRPGDELPRKKGDFLFETGHIIEVATKLYLVVQSATGRAPHLNISAEFELNLGKETAGVIVFRSTGLPEPTHLKITRKGARLEVVL